MKFWELMTIVLLTLMLVSFCTSAEAEYIPVAEPDSYHIEVRDALKADLTAV